MYQSTSSKVEPSLVENPPTPQQLIELGYRPIDNSSSSPLCFENNSIIDRLGSLPRIIYTQFLDRQDRRDDIGHANIVTHFTLELARLLKLDQAQTDAVSISAIGHDIGWSCIENIAEVFVDIISRKQRGALEGGDALDAARAKEEDRALRIRHQDEAVNLIRPFLTAHPLAREICDTIADHDTRIKPFPYPFAAFLDADWLWRVTVRQLDSRSAGDWDTSNQKEVFEFLKATSEKLPFLLSQSTSIARLEAANTMVAMQKRHGWDSLLGEFERNYAEELAVLRGLSSSTTNTSFSHFNTWRAVLNQPIESGTLSFEDNSKVSLPQSYRQKLEQCFFPDAQVDMLDAWHSALSNSGMPIDFASTHEYRQFTFQVANKGYASIKMSGIDHEKRREIIKAQQRYQPQLPIDFYGLRVSSACDLDFNILQAVEAQRGVHNVHSNALGIFGDFIWLVNKFPYHITDGLILPKNHDPEQGRALYIPDGKKWLKRQESDTRGNIVEYDYLATVFAICDRFNQIAHRNHAMDGMSIPLHDHFKTISEKHSSMLLLEEFIRADLQRSDTVIAYHAINTPFDTLCLTSSNHNRLALVGSQLLEALERNDQIYTPIYYKGHLLITPRNSELYGDGNPDGWTGSSVGAHIIEDPIENPDHLRRILKFVPLQGQYDWERFLSQQQIELVS